MQNNEENTKKFKIMQQNVEKCKNCRKMKKKEAKYCKIKIMAMMMMEFLATVFHSTKYSMLRTVG